MEAKIILNKDFNKLLEKIDKLEKKIDNLATHNSFEDSWLDIPKVCAILKISKRTLQTYRDNGILSFSQHGTKIYVLS